MQYPISPLMEAIQDAFPTVRSLGVYNRRPISGSTRWSDHSWGAAWDIRPPDDDPAYVSQGSRRVTLDDVYDWLLRHKRSGTEWGPLKEKIGMILWRTRDHWNHIHVQYEPRYSDRYGTPPYSRDFRAWWEAILAGEDYNVAALEVEDLQEALNGAGCTDYEGKPLVVDGVYGRRTQSAWIKGLSPAAGGVEGDFVTKAIFNDHRHAEGTTGKPL